MPKTHYVQIYVQNFAKIYANLIDIVRTILLIYVRTIKRGLNGMYK